MTNVTATVLEYLKNLVASIESDDVYVTSFSNTVDTEGQELNIAFSRRLR